MSVRAAVTAVQEGHSLGDVLRRSVDFTGDVDTVATIALAAGSCAEDLADDLPERLLSGLEAGRFGLPYLRSLDERLLALATT
jgi:ADP-ribosylglycohydrolase